ncbi:GNAT family N-acetyltransferase [Rheinheimera sp.]|uniref:GNAT family N-acetyltransferase n=1 Tax=Rheinheimera sp. TaxID=1869214 RepID=UPI00307DF48C
MQWQHCRFHELSAETLYQILQLRVDVFVVEQNCPYPELDGKDLLPGTVHLYLHNAQKVLAYARILPPGASYPDTPSLGRICVAQSARQLALGKELVRRAMELAAQHWPATPIRISAQCYLQRFYESFGFIACSEAYLEDNIPHLEMLRPA